jgi:hypothetical protein
MSPYQLYLHGRAYETLASFSAAERKTPISLFHRLANDPFQPRDYAELAEGFDVSVMLMGRHAILYRVDHAVKEIKIVDVRQAD